MSAPHPNDPDYRRKPEIEDEDLEHPVKRMLKVESGKHYIGSDAHRRDARQGRAIGIPAFRGSPKSSALKKRTSSPHGVVKSQMDVIAKGLRGTAGAMHKRAKHFA